MEQDQFIDDLPNLPAHSKPQIVRLPKLNPFPQLDPFFLDGKLIFDVNLPSNVLHIRPTSFRMHSNETSPEMRQIRVLENRLDKVMIKYNEAPSLPDFSANMGD